jgi:hypothetical protein
MIARKLRPKSGKEYREMIYENVKQLRAKPTNPSYVPLSVINYDLALFTPFNNLIDEVFDIDELARLGASATELDKLPMISYGKEGKPGVFRIACNCLGALKDFYITAIDEEKIKKCTSMKDFTSLLKTFNVEMAKEAEHLRTINYGNTPIGKGLDEYNKVQTDKSAKKFQQHFRATQEKSKYSPGELTIMHSLKMAQREERGSDLDSDECESIPDKDHHSEEDGSDADASLRFLEKKAQYSKKDNAKKVYACYQKFKTGKCELQNCPYSHQEKDLIDFAKEFICSPYRQYIVETQGDNQKHPRPNPAPGSKSAVKKLFRVEKMAVGKHAVSEDASSDNSESA